MNLDSFSFVTAQRSKIREKQLQRERNGDRERKRDEWAFLA